MDKKKYWLNKQIKNVNLCNYSNKKLKKKPLYYLNSNKFQIDTLYNRLVNYSKFNKQYYYKYEYDVIKQNEKDFNYPKSLFYKEMLKDFTNFCFTEK